MTHLRDRDARALDHSLMPTDNILALHAARDGTLYATVLYPFTLLRFEEPVRE